MGSGLLPPNPAEAAPTPICPTVYKIVEGKPFWTLVAGFPGYQVELKGRCDAAGRWKVILEASVSGV